MKSFFDTIRPHFPGGKLTASQVSGINDTIAGFQLYGNGNLQTLAYILATEARETGWAFQPIVERGNRKYFDKYEPGTKIGKDLGNTQVGDGFLFRGRGKGQITGRANYRRVGKLIGVDLETHPERALETDIAVRILVEGGIKGWFTGKGFADYIDGIDESDAEDRKEFLEARRAINGVDHREEIADNALMFERALKAVAQSNPHTAGAPKPVPTPKPPETPATEPETGRNGDIMGVVLVGGAAVLAALAVWFIVMIGG